MDMLVSPLLEKDEQKELREAYIPFYIVLVVIFGIMTLAAMYITYKHEPILHRYIEDKVDPMGEEE